MRRPTLLAVIATLTMAVAVPVPVSADSHPVNGPCNHDYQNRQTYGIVTHAGATGGQVAIETWNPSLCNTTDDPVLNGSITWVGVQVAGNGYNGNSIIQVGVGKCNYPTYPACDGQYHVFYAYGRDINDQNCLSTLVPQPRTLGGGVPAGTHTYQVYRTGQKVVFLRDGNEIDSINASTVSCWTADSVAYSGEGWDEGDQVGGSFGNHQSLTSALYQPAAGASWTSPGFTTCYTQLVGSYNCSKVSGNAIDIWTDNG